MQDLVMIPQMRLKLPQERVGSRWDQSVDHQKDHLRQEGKVLEVSI